MLLSPTPKCGKVTKKAPPVALVDVSPQNPRMLARHHRWIGCLTLHICRAQGIPKRNLYFSIILLRWGSIPSFTAYLLPWFIAEQNLISFLYTFDFTLGWDIKKTWAKCSMGLECLPTLILKKCLKPFIHVGKYSLVPFVAWPELPGGSQRRGDQVPALLKEVLAHFHWA